MHTRSAVNSLDRITEKNSGDEIGKKKGSPQRVVSEGAKISSKKRKVEKGVEDQINFRKKKKMGLETVQSTQEIDNSFGKQNNQDKPTSSVVQETSHIKRKEKSGQQHIIGKGDKISSEKRKKAKSDYSKQRYLNIKNNDKDRYEAILIQNRQCGKIRRDKSKEKNSARHKAYIEQVKEDPVKYKRLLERKKKSNQDYRDKIQGTEKHEEIKAKQRLKSRERSGVNYKKCKETITSLSKKKSPSKERTKPTTTTNGEILEPQNERKKRQYNELQINHPEELQQKRKKINAKAKQLAEEKRIKDPIGHQTKLVSGRLKRAQLKRDNPEEYRRQQDKYNEQAKIRYHKNEPAKDARNQKRCIARRAKYAKDKQNNTSHYQKQCSRRMKRYYNYTEEEYKEHLASSKRSYQKHRINHPDMLKEKIADIRENHPDKYEQMLQSNRDYHQEIKKDPVKWKKYLDRHNRYRTMISTIFPEEHERRLQVRREDEAVWRKVNPNQYLVSSGKVKRQNRKEMITKFRDGSSSLTQTQQDEMYAVLTSQLKQAPTSLAQPLGAVASICEPVTLIDVEQQSCTNESSFTQTSNSESTSNQYHSNDTQYDTSQTEQYIFRREDNVCLLSSLCTMEEDLEGGGGNMNKEDFYISNNDETNDDEYSLFNGELPRTLTQEVNVENIVTGRIKQYILHCNYNVISWRNYSSVIIFLISFVTTLRTISDRLLSIHC